MDAQDWVSLKIKFEDATYDLYFENEREKDKIYEFYFGHEDTYTDLVIGKKTKRNCNFSNLFARICARRNVL